MSGKLLEKKSFAAVLSFSLLKERYDGILIKAIKKQQKAFYNGAHFERLHEKKPKETVQTVLIPPLVSKIDNPA